ncbi:transposase [Micromonospora sp. NPDC000089]|uniref:transposase n=1 Tax=unclassified Micromonospora TaxID=2617518 RepID=UPI0036B8B681
MLTFAGFPRGVWCQNCSNKLQERLNKESRRRTGLVGLPRHPRRSSASAARSWPSRPTIGPADAAGWAKVAAASNHLHHGPT